MTLCGGYARNRMTRVVPDDLLHLGLRTDLGYGAGASMMLETDLVWLLTGGLVIARVQRQSVSVDLV